MSTARERFITVLTGQYEYLFTLPDYTMAAARTTPATLAEKMAAGLVDGSADKDGEGIKRTCKALGIKPTYKAIKAFITEGAAA